MSTELTQAHGVAHLSDEGGPQRFSLAALVAALRSLRATPSLEHLNSLLQEVELDEEDLRPYRSFKPGTYARHRVYRNDFAATMKSGGPSALVKKIDELSAKALK